MASLVNIALILLRKWILCIKIFVYQGRCYNFKPLTCATSSGPNCLVCPIPYLSANVFQSLCNLSEGLCYGPEMSVLGPKQPTALYTLKTMWLTILWNWQFFGNIKCCLALCTLTLLGSTYLSQRTVGGGPRWPHERKMANISAVCSPFFKILLSGGSFWKSSLIFTP